MIKVIVFSLLLAMTVRGAFSSDLLYESEEYRQAIQNGTRTREGLPGPNYWQNTSKYTIRADFDPQSGIIEGELQLRYFNNSPHTLQQFYFKLMHDFYKHGARRQLPAMQQDLHEGVEIMEVTYEGSNLPASALSRAGTNLQVALPQPIAGGDSVVFLVKYRLPLPRHGGLRTGFYDSTSVFAGYWFPQAAVYDDIFGWDTESYIGLTENYNDFSDYDVHLTLPAQYVVWATGALVNEGEMFDTSVLARLIEAKKSNEVVRIIDEANMAARRKRPGRATWHFRARQVPDFAWAASNHYVWDAVSAQNHGAQSACLVSAVYPSGARFYDQVALFAKSSIEIMSGEFPGLPYPYHQHTTFNGLRGGGMEFPMIANNNESRDIQGALTVTAHEIAHNYFPFLMGSNERKYGWFDETFTSLMEDHAFQAIMPDTRQGGAFNIFRSYPDYADAHWSVPLMTETGNTFDYMAIIVNFYVKGPVAMEALKRVVGADNFKSWLREFMLTWQGRHCTPYDFFYFFNNKSDSDLGWFWKPWFFQSGYADVGIGSVKASGGSMSVTVTNPGLLPVPVCLELTYHDGSSEMRYVKIEEWAGQPSDLTLQIKPQKPVAAVRIRSDYFFDANSDNNSWFSDQ